MLRGMLSQNSTAELQNTKKLHAAKWKRQVIIGGTAHRCA